MSPPLLRNELAGTHFRGSTFGLCRRPKAGAANRCRLAVFVSFVSFVFTFGCSSKPAEPQQIVAVTRQVGAWSGRGNETVGDVNSETGRLRISWQTTNESVQGGGTFKLTLRSG